jgi:pimeloyl-ACP methyl ester carboxylesterase
MGFHPPQIKTCCCERPSDGKKHSVMIHPRWNNILVTLLALGLLCAACGPTASEPDAVPTEMTRDAGPPIRPEPGAGSSEGPGYTPSFESAECQFNTPSDYKIECGYLTVPEDRSQPEGTSIRLHVAIFKSTNPNPTSDPVIHLEGGPGGSSLDSASVYLETGGDEFLATRDYVMFNQRGTRYAVPSLECPGYAELMWEMAKQGLSREAQQERETEFLLDCQNDLLDQGINLAAYNSAANAADVGDLRIALGYEQVNLYGISYGSRLALTVMRDTPDGIRSVILDSVYPPQVDLYSQTPANAARAFKMVFADCAAEADCNRTYPDLERTFYRVIDELNANPQRVTLSHGSVTIDGDNFMDLAFGALYRKDAIPLVPHYPPPWKSCLNMDVTSVSGWLTRCNVEKRCLLNQTGTQAHQAWTCQPKSLTILLLRSSLTFVQRGSLGWPILSRTNRWSAIFRPWCWQEVMTPSRHQPGADSPLKRSTIASSTSSLASATT